MMEPTSRRKFLGTATGAAIGASLLKEAGGSTPESDPKGRVSFKYCLNTSTIRGQNLGLIKEIEVAAEAGYDAVELWTRAIRAHLSEGQSLKDLDARIKDLGLTVESAIGFAKWIVDDPQERAAGLEEAKKDMEIVAKIGGKRMAAPPAGATRRAGLDLFQAAKRYRALLDLGEKMGVTPMLEVWGFSKNLHRLGEAVLVAIESGHPDACLLPDVYHIYKGGSDFTGLKMLSQTSLPAFHMNDYPADPPRETIADKDRVYPGDGVAPLDRILQDLAGINAGMVLSLELFNPTYWKQDAVDVAKTGLSKLKAAVESALG